jgi:hypothetical protein
VSALLMAAPEDAPAMPPPVRLTRRQTCANHRPFETELEAWAHYVGQLIANRMDPGQTVYRCGSHWHHGGGIRSLGRLLAEEGWDDATPVD